MGSHCLDPAIEKTKKGSGLGRGRGGGGESNANIHTNNYVDLNKNINSISLKTLKREF
jgi:hypothetical protein